MPYVNVRVAGALTGPQKKEIVARITQVMEEVAGKPPAATYVVIDEVPRHNWAKSGELLEEPPA
jgi:4-oxalocrotonate tautomerase